MKKTLIALAALAATVGVAHAQSSVTLYGLLDVEIGSFKTNTAVGANVQNLTQTRINDGASGGLQGSRWGMRIREDLGGGLAAVANLESGFAIDAGSSAQGGLLFGRRANVGLTGGFGTVTLGRQSSAYTDVAADHAMMAATAFDPSNTNNAYSAFNNTSGAAAFPANGLLFTQAGGVTTAASNQIAAAFLGRNTTWIGYSERINNSIKYVSPNFGGLTAAVLYGFGEDKTAAASASKTVSASLKYANGPLVISGGYQNEGFARTAAVKPSLINTIISGSYDFGVAKVGLGFNRAKYEGVVGATGGDLASQKEYSFSVAVPLGATTLSAGVAQSKGDDLGKSTGYGIQALYSLSKRTTLYAGALSTKAYDKLAASTVAGYAGSSIGRTTTYAAGLRHTF